MPCWAAAAMTCSDWPCIRSSSARSKAAQPIWFVTPRTLRQGRRQARQARPRLRQGRGLRAAARPASDAAGGRRHRRRAVRPGEPEGRPQRVPARPAARRCCPPAPTASPTRRTTRGSPRWPSRSAPIASPATARPDDKAVRLVLPDGVDGDDLSPHRRRRDARPRPDQHAGQRHGPGRARGGRPRARRSSTARNSASIVGDDLLEAEFPADPRRRPRRRSEPRAAADRPALGQGRPIRR